MSVLSFKIPGWRRIYLRVGFLSLNVYVVRVFCRAICLMSISESLRIDFANLLPSVKSLYKLNFAHN